LTVGVVEGASLEHGSEDTEPAVGDAAQSASVGAASGPQGGVIGAGRVVMLEAGAGPVIEGVAEAGIAAVAHEDDEALATAHSDGRESGEGAQLRGVGGGEERGGFGQEGGSDDGPHAGQGEEQGDVARTTSVLLLVFGGVLIQQALQLLDVVLPLLVRDAQARQQQGNVGAGGFDGARSDPERFFMERAPHVFCGDAANAMTAKELLGLRRAEPSTGSAFTLSTSSQNQGSSADPESVRRCGTERCSCSRRRFVSRFISSRRSSSARESSRIWMTNGWSRPPVETCADPCNYVRLHVGIAPVVFATRHAVPIAEAVDLLRVQRVDVQTSLLHGFHQRTPRDLDRHRYPFRPAPDAAEQGVQEGLNRARTVLDRFLLENVACGREHAGLMRSGRPTDANQQV